MHVRVEKRNTSGFIPDKGRAILGWQTYSHKIVVCLETTDADHCVKKKIAKINHYNCSQERCSSDL